MKSQPEWRFLFRLALALGEPRPRRLLLQLTSREWAEWLAYWSVEPWGEERADFRSGLAACAISNRWRGKSEKPLKPTDFMPFSETPWQSPDQIKAKVQEVLNSGPGRTPKH